MTRIVALVAVALLGCGRVGYDLASAAADGSGPDGNLVDGGQVDAVGPDGPMLLFPAETGLSVSSPQIAWNGDRYGVVFQYGSQFATTVRAVELSATGTPLTPFETLPSPQQLRSVTASGSDFVVTWDEGGVSGLPQLVYTAAAAEVSIAFSGQLDSVPSSGRAGCDPDECLLASRELSGDAFYARFASPNTVIEQGVMFGANPVAIGNPVFAGGSWHIPWTDDLGIHITSTAGGTTDVLGPMVEPRMVRDGDRAGLAWVDGLDVFFQALSPDNQALGSATALTPGTTLPVALVHFQTTSDGYVLIQRENIGIADNDFEYVAHKLDANGAELAVLPLSLPALAVTFTSRGDQIVMVWSDGGLWFGELGF